MLIFLVSYSTLCSRINGQPSRRIAYLAQQLLTEAEKITLCDWIEFYALIAKPLDIQGILLLAGKVSGKKLGKNWLDYFKKCHPKILHSKPGGPDPKQVQNFNLSNVAGFYNLLKAIYNMYPNLLPEHIWNMDEKGLQLGRGYKRSKKYFYLKSLKKTKFY
jgi:hypothetical protein